MIKFFRKIRQNLLSEGKTGKYLKYAIGEIILVVIGILIALQVNNWNEDRKVINQQNNGLAKLKSDIAKDSSAIFSLITRLDQDIQMQQELIDHLDIGKKLDSSFNNHLGNIMIMSNLNFVTNGYNVLNKIGIEKLNDKTLQNLIIKYYDSDIKKIITDNRHDEEEFSGFWQPYLVSNFKDWQFGRFGIPNDYEALSNDSKFLMMLKMNIKNRQSTLRGMSEAQRDIRKLIKEINRYSLR